MTIHEQIKSRLAEIEQRENAATPGPWFENPYRAIIGQYDPKTKPDPEKKSVLLLSPAAAMDGPASP